MPGTIDFLNPIFHGMIFQKTKTKLCIYTDGQNYKTPCKIISVVNVTTYKSKLISNFN